MVRQSPIKPSFLKITPPLQSSIIIKTDRALETPWHFHPEIELLYSIKGKGTDFVGNAISGIEEGELLLFGKNLPHTRLGNKEFYAANPSDKPEAIVIQFSEDFLGADFFDVEEFKHLKDLISRAGRGLRFSGSVKDLVAPKLHRIRELKGMYAMMELLMVLDILSQTDEYIYFNPAKYVFNAHEKSSLKINLVYHYTIGHFRENISLEKVASLTNQSRSAFCRFFKTHTRTSYFQYLNEIRIAYACELLREGNHDVTRACFASGFNNLSNFHRQFKKIAQVKPNEYRQLFQK